MDFTTFEFAWEVANKVGGIYQGISPAKPYGVGR